MELAWYLSCDGDGAHIGTRFPEMPPSYETFKQIIQNAERSGFTTILIPTSQDAGHYGPEAPAWDSVVNATMLAPVTSTIKLLLAIRMGIIDPAICARMLSSLDHLSNGRILLNVVTGGSALSMYGEELDHDARYRRTEEYLQVLDGLWTQPSFSFDGEFYRLKDAVSYPKPLQQPRVPIYLPGSSEIARDIAIRRADYYVFWGESASQVAERIAEMEQRLQGTEKRLKYVTRFQIIARPTEAEAYEAAQELLSRVDPEVLAYRGKTISEMDSAGTRDQQARTRDEMVGPNLWAGMGRVRRGSAVAITGSYEQCAERISELEQAGVDLLILSGFPLHSECERVGRHVIPLVREMGKKHQARSAAPVA